MGGSYSNAIGSRVANISPEMGRPVLPLQCCSAFCSTAATACDSPQLLLAMLSHKAAEDGVLDSSQPTAIGRQARMNSTFSLNRAEKASVYAGLKLISIYNSQSMGLEGGFEISVI